MTYPEKILFAVSILKVAGYVSWTYETLKVPSLVAWLIAILLTIFALQKAINTVAANTGLHHQESRLSLFYKPARRQGLQVLRSLHR